MLIGCCEYASIYSVLLLVFESAVKEAPPPRKSPRQARSHATVDAILDATARILVERGYVNVTTNAVSERAGVSVGSLYQYFPNKESLLGAVRLRHSERMEREVLRAFDQPEATSFDDGMRRAIEAVIKAHLVEPDLHQALEGQFAVSDNTSAHDCSVDMVLERLTIALVKHRRQFTIEDEKTSAFVLTQAIHSLAHAMIRSRPGGISVQQMTREVVCLARGYLVCPR